MNYSELRDEIKHCADSDFKGTSDAMQKIIFSQNIGDVCELLVDIGFIPEDIVHDSSEEKLYTKTSEILFAKALDFMNMDCPRNKRAS